MKPTKNGIRIQWAWQGLICHSVWDFVNRSQTLCSEANFSFWPSVTANSQRKATARTKGMTVDLGSVSPVCPSLWHSGNTNPFPDCQLILCTWQRIWKSIFFFSSLTLFLRRVQKIWHIIFKTPKNMRTSCSDIYTNLLKPFQCQFAQLVLAFTL